MVISSRCRPLPESFSAAETDFPDGRGAEKRSTDTSRLVDIMALTTVSFNVSPVVD